MRPMSASPITFEIQRLGAQGDGVAEHEGRQIFVPLTLPGEIVTAEVNGDRARVVEILKPSPARAGARCSHYGECGGCSLQHLADDQYLAFKREHVVTALSFQKIDAPVDPVVAIGPRSRRRAVFAAHRVGNDIALGFHGRRSHRIVPISDCAVIFASACAVAAPARESAQIAMTAALRFELMSIPLMSW